MEDKNKKTAEQAENEKIGKMSGMAGGAVTGAAIGTSILPVVGTFAGALVGGVVGSEIGQKVGGKILNTLDKLSETKTDAAPAKTDVAAELEKLSKLHDDGVLDDDEFRAAKAQLLNMK
jgi:phage tail tape-measure protein